MQNISTTSLGLSLDASRYSSNLSKVQKSTTRVLDSLTAQAQVFSDSWADITHNLRSAKSVASSMALYATFTGITTGATLASAAVLDFSKNLENARTSMTYFIDGADKATQTLAYLREMQALAADTSFSTESAINLSKFMASMGVNIRATKSVMTVINDAAAATGADEAKMQSIVTAMGQILTKGRLAAEEIRQLANANIPIYDILQEQLNLTGDQIKNIGNHWIAADKAVVAILTGLQSRYKGAAAEIADTLAGMTNSIADNSLMISQVATSGIYDAAAEKIMIIRDALQKYRDTAVNEGSTSLLRQLLLDIDSSGEVGTMLLALVGNVRNLISAFSDLYMSAKPIISVLGKGLYYQVQTLTIATTALSEVLNTVTDALDNMGISSEKVVQVLSGLYISYKIAKTLGTVGQASAAVAMNFYNMAHSALTAIPALNALSTAQKAGIITALGLGSAILLTTGALDGLSNMLSGLDASGDILPNDFEEQFNEYQKAMEEYNSAITAYSDGFDAAFTSIAESGASTFLTLQKKSEKSAKKSADAWLASFDEVYKVPEDNDSGNDDDKDKTFPDLSGLLHGLTFKFPTAADIAPTMPTFNWSDVYDTAQTGLDGVAGSISALGPFLLLGVTSWLGKSFVPKMAAENAKKGLSAVGAISTEVKAGASAADLQQALAEQARANKALQTYIAKYSSTDDLKSLDEAYLKRLISEAEEQNDLVAKLSKKTDNLVQTFDDDITKATDLLYRKQANDTFNAIQNLRNELRSVDAADADKIADLKAKLGDYTADLKRTVKKISPDAQSFLSKELLRVVRGLPEQSAEELANSLYRALTNLYSLNITKAGKYDITSTDFKHVLSTADRIAGDIKKLPAETLKTNERLTALLSDYENFQQYNAATTELLTHKAYADYEDGTWEKAQYNKWAANARKAASEIDLRSQVYNDAIIKNSSNSAFKTYATTVKNALETYDADILGVYRALDAGIPANIDSTLLSQALDKPSKAITSVISSVSAAQNALFKEELKLMISKLDQLNASGTKLTTDDVMGLYKVVLKRIGYDDESQITVLADALRAKAFGSGTDDVYGRIMSVLQPFRQNSLAKPISDLYVANDTVYKTRILTVLDDIQNDFTDLAAGTLKQVNSAQDMHTALAAALMRDTDTVYVDIGNLGSSKAVNSSMAKLLSGYSGPDNILKPATVSEEALDALKEANLSAQAASINPANALAIKARSLGDSVFDAVEDTLASVLKAQIKVSVADQQNDITKAISTFTNKLTDYIENGLIGSIDDVPFEYDSTDILKSIEALEARILLINNGNITAVSNVQEMLLRSFTDMREKLNSIAASYISTLIREGADTEDILGASSRALKASAEVAAMQAAVANNATQDSIYKFLATAIDDDTNKLYDVIKSIAANTEDIGYTTAKAFTGIYNSQNIANNVASTFAYKPGTSVTLEDLKGLKNLTGAKTIEWYIPRKDNLKALSSLGYNLNVAVDKALDVLVNAALPASDLNWANSQLAAVFNDTRAMRSTDIYDADINSILAKAEEVNLQNREKTLAYIKQMAKEQRYALDTVTKHVDIFASQSAKADYTLANTLHNATTTTYKPSDIIDTAITERIKKLAKEGIITSASSIYNGGIGGIISDEQKAIIEAAISKRSYGTYTAFRDTGHLLGGMDFGTMINGASQYGTRFQNVLAKELRNASAYAERFSPYIIADMMRGQLIEDALGPVLQDIVGTDKEVVRAGETLYDYARGFKVQNDFQRVNKTTGEYIGAIETKATNKADFVDDLKKIFANRLDTKTGMYALIEEDLGELIKRAPDWFYQIAAQATMLDSKESILAIVDASRLPDSLETLTRAKDAAAMYTKQGSVAQQKAARQILLPWLQNTVLGSRSNTDISKFTADLTDTLITLNRESREAVYDIVTSEITTWLEKSYRNSSIGINNLTEAITKSLTEKGITVDDAFLNKIADFVQVGSTDTLKANTYLFKFTVPDKFREEILNTATLYGDYITRVNKVLANEVATVDDIMQTVLANNTVVGALPRGRQEEYVNSLRNIHIPELGSGTTGVEVIRNTDKAIPAQTYVKKLVETILDNNLEASKQAYAELTAFTEVLEDLPKRFDTLGDDIQNYSIFKGVGKEKAFLSVSTNKAALQNADGAINTLHDIIRELDSLSTVQLTKAQEAITNLNKYAAQFFERQNIETTLTPSTFTINHGTKTMLFSDYQQMAARTIASWEKRLGGPEVFKNGLLSKTILNDMHNGIVRFYDETLEGLDMSMYKFGNLQNVSQVLTDISNGTVKYASGLSEVTATMHGDAETLLQILSEDMARHAPKVTESVDTAELLTEAATRTKEAIDTAADIVKQASTPEDFTRIVRELQNDDIQNLINTLTKRGIKLQDDSDIFTRLSFHANNFLDRLYTGPFSGRVTDRITGVTGWRSTIHLPVVNNQKSFLNSLGFDDYFANSELVDSLKATFTGSDATDVVKYLDNAFANATAGLDKTIGQYSVTTLRKSVLQAAADAGITDTDAINTWFKTLIKHSPSLTSDSMRSIIKSYSGVFADYNKLLKRIDKATVADDIVALRRLAADELTKIVNNTVANLTEASKLYEPAKQVLDTAKALVGSGGAETLNDAFKLLGERGIPTELLEQAKQIAKGAFDYTSELTALKIASLPEDTNLDVLKTIITGMQDAMKNGADTLDAAFDIMKSGLDSELKNSVELLRPSIMSLIDLPESLETVAKELDAVESLGATAKLKAVSRAVQAFSADTATKGITQYLKVAGKTITRGLGHAATLLKNVAFADVLGVGPLDFVAAGIDYIATDTEMKQQAATYSSVLPTDLAYTMASADISDISSKALADITGLTALYKDAFYDLSAYATRTAIDFGAQISGYLIGMAVGAGSGSAAGGPIGAAIGAIASLAFQIGQDLLGFNTAWAAAKDELNSYILEGQAYANLANKDLSAETVSKYGLAANAQAAYTLAQTANESWWAASNNDSPIGSIASLFDAMGSAETLGGIKKYLDMIDNGTRSLYYDLAQSRIASSDKTDAETKLASTLLQSAADVSTINNAFGDNLISEAAGLMQVLQMTKFDSALYANANGSYSEDFNKAQKVAYGILGDYMQEMLTATHTDKTQYAADLATLIASVDDASSDVDDYFRELQYTFGDIADFKALVTQLFGNVDFDSSMAANVYYAETVAKLLKEYNTAQAQRVTAQAVLATASTGVSDDGSAYTAYTALDMYQAPVAEIKKYAEEFAEATGITIGTISDLGFSISGLSDEAASAMYAIKTNGEDFVDKIDGWTISSNLDVTTLTPNEVTVLATAGIQINSDGTISFARAQNEDISGTERFTEYDKADISEAFANILKNGGIYIDGYGAGDNEIKLDDTKIRENITEAMFDLSGMFPSQSAAAATALSGKVAVVDGNGNIIDYEHVSEGLGEYSSDTGIFTLTNKDILSGNKTIAEWFEEYEAAASEYGSVISDTTKSVLLAIDEALKPENGASGVNLDWAKGIGVTLDGSMDYADEETLAVLSSLGLEITEFGDSLKAIISNYSNTLTDGKTRLTSAAWNQVSDETVTKLEEMGVAFKEVGNWVEVDVSGVLNKSGESLLAIYQTLPGMLNNTSAAFQNWLKAIGMIDESGEFLQWTPSQQSIFAKVDSEKNADEGYERRFATAALEYTGMADKLRAIGDSMTTKSEQVKSLIANDLTYIDILSNDTLSKLDINGDGIINEAEQLGDGVYIAMSELDDSIVAELAKAYGYSEQEVEKFKADFGGIRFKEATEEQFMGVKDAYNGIFDELENSMKENGLELEESAKQIGAAVAAALKGEFEDLRISNVNISSVGVDDRYIGWGFGNSKPSDFKGYIGDAPKDFSDATKQSGGANSYRVYNSYTEVFVDGTKYVVDTTSVEDALLAVGRNIYGSDYDPNDTSEAAKNKKLRIRYNGVGYANGGIIDDDGLYRIAEQNRKEAIIPLENPTVSAHIGAAMASMMLASEQWRSAESLIGLQNGGLPSALTERPAAVQQQSTEEMSSRMVDTVLQRVLPAIAQQNSGSDADSMRPLYVGTLIADDTGIRELNKRMQVIEAKETRRR